MGLTKQYLRYEPYRTFGIVASQRCNVSFVNINEIAGRYLAVGGAENLLIWDLRTGEKMLQQSASDRQEVCQIAVSPDQNNIAVGLVDGSLEIYSLKTRATIARLALHRTAVNCLRFDDSGLKVASGGLDTDIVIVDLVTQTGKCRLMGHSKPVTDVHFTQRFENVLVSCSKDTQVILIFFFFNTTQSNIRNYFR